MKKGVFIFASLIVLSVFMFGFVNSAVCEVMTRAECHNLPWNDNIVMELSNYTNAHAALVDQNQYGYVLCCNYSGGVFSQCDGVRDMVVLSAETNAHVEVPKGGNYNEDEYCVGYENLYCEALATCPGGSEAILSLYDYTNSHVGRADVYPIKICCSSEEIAPPVCNGNGICEAGETCLGCPLDNCCPPTDCEVTSVSWMPITRADGQTVTLNLDTTGTCAEETVSFEIFERDGICPLCPRTSVQSQLTDPPTTLVLEDGHNQISWVVQWLNMDGEDEDVEYDFLVTVSSTLEQDRSGELKVSPEEAPLPEWCELESIEYCGQYNEANCSLDDCDVAEPEDMGNLCVKNNHCEWNDDSNICELKSPEICIVGGEEVAIGTCTYTESSDDENGCEDGFLDYSWTIDWNWGEDNEFGEEVDGEEGYYFVDTLNYWVYDPNKEYEACQPGENPFLPCTAKIELSFFKWQNIILVILILSIVYYLSKKKEKKSKNKKRK